MVCTVCFLSWWKILAPWPGSWYFELVQIFLINWIVFARHTWFAMPVFFCDGKFLLEAVRIFSLSNYSWTIGFQIVSLGTHGMHCEKICSRELEFWACPNVLDQLDCFDRHAWFALTVFFCDGKFLPRQLELWAYPTIVEQLDCRLFC